MSIWHIYGGNRLTGSTQVQGAKNAVLPIMAASVLAGSETVLHNVPDLKDVTITLRILRHLGCTAERDGDTVRIDSRGMNRDFIPHDLMRELRSSVIFLGAILTRFGTASLSMPGGCELGPRPVNLHLDALRALGVKNFDLCFVCIGSDFASSLLITSMLKDMGAARVVAKASQDIHAKLLLRNGADDVVYPERDSAERMATRLSAQNVFDYIELTDEYSIYEIAPLENWVGHSIREIDVRNKYHINILGVKESGVLKPLPGGDYRFTGNEHLLAMAAREDAKKLLRRI